MTNHDSFLNRILDGLAVFIGWAIGTLVFAYLLYLVS